MKRLSYRRWHKHWQYTKEHRTRIQGWAFQQGINSRSVQRYFKNPDMRVSTLFTISQVLEYNFIHDIAGMLPADLKHAATPQYEKSAALEKRNEILKVRLELLKGLMGR